VIGVPDDEPVARSYEIRGHRPSHLREADEPDHLATISVSIRVDLLACLD
jgi:hypothetical protein